MSNKAIALPQDFTPEKATELYNEIMRIYDLTDAVLESIIAEGVTNGELQYQIVEPFVKSTLTSANIISDYYVAVVQRGRPLTPKIQETFEMAFRLFFISLKELIDRIEDRLLPQEGNL